MPDAKALLGRVLENDPEPRQLGRDDARALVGRVFDRPLPVDSQIDDDADITGSIGTALAGAGGQVAGFINAAAGQARATGKVLAGAATATAIDTVERVERDGLGAVVLDRVLGRRRPLGDTGTAVMEQALRMGDQDLAQSAAIGDVIEGVEGEIQKAIGFTPADTPGKAFLEELVQGGTSLGIGIAATAASGGSTVVGGAALGLVEGAAIYEDVLAAEIEGGASRAEAEQKAVAAGALGTIASATLERMGLEGLLRTKKLTRFLPKIAEGRGVGARSARIGVASSSEGLTEGAQGVTASLIQAFATDDWDGFAETYETLDPVRKDVLLGMAIGGPVRGGVETVDAFSSVDEARAALADRVESVSGVDEAVKESDNAQENGDAEANQEATNDRAAEVGAVGEQEGDGRRNPQEQEQGEGEVPPGGSVGPVRIPDVEAERVALGRFAQAVGDESVRAVEPVTETERTLAGFAAARGARVRFVESSDGAPLSLPAMHRSGVIVIDRNAGPQEQLRGLVYHELFHELERADPELWVDLDAQIQQIDPEGYQRARQEYADGFQRATGQEATDARLDVEGPSIAAERVADYLAQSFDNPASIEKLAADPTLARRVLDLIQRVARRLGIKVGRTEAEKIPDARLALALRDGLDALLGREFTPTSTAVDAPTQQRQGVTGENHVVQEDSAPAAEVEGPPAPEVTADPPAVRPSRPQDRSLRSVTRSLREFAEASDRFIEPDPETALDAEVPDLTGSRVFSFRGEIPTEVREALAGAPNAVKAMFKGNVRNAEATGADAMSELGADRLVELAAQYANPNRAKDEARLKHLRDLVGYRDYRDTYPDAELVMFLQERLRPSDTGKGVDPANKKAYAKREVIDNAGSLPDGATFSLLGETFVVGREDGEVFAVSASGEGFRLSGVDAVPIDPGTLDADAGAELPSFQNSDPLAGLPFAVRRGLAESDGDTPRDLLGRPTFDADTGRQREMEFGTETPLDLEQAAERAKREREIGDDPGQLDLFAVRGMTPEEKFGVQSPLFNGFDVAPVSVADKIRRSVQDQFIQLRRTQDALKKQGGKVTESADAYMQEELSHGVAGERNRAFREKYADPIIDTMKQAGLTLQQVDAYLYALHAPERNKHIASINPEFRKQGIPGSGMSTVEAKAIVNRAHAGDQAAAYKQIARKVKQARKQALREMVADGLMMQEQADAWQTRFEHYVPLKHDDDGNQFRRHAPVGRSLGARGPESKRALGRTTRADSPLASLFSDIESTHIRAERNKVGQAFLEMVEANPDPVLWEIDKPARKRRFDEKTGLVVWGSDPQVRNDPNTFIVKRDGEEVRITIHNDDLARAMNRLGTKSIGKVLQTLGTFNRLRSAAITSYSPEFIVTNLVRDVQTAMAVAGVDVDLKAAKKIAKNTLPAARGAFQVLRGKNTGGDWAKEFVELREAGGLTGWSGAHSIQQRAGMIARDLAMSGPGKHKAAMRGARGFMNLVADTNTAIENGARLALYRELRSRGVSKRKAASAAKNLTVNFNRRGEGSTVLNALYLFFNASVQGSHRVLSTVLGSRKGRALGASIIAMGALQDMLNSALSDEDEDGELFWDKIPEWERTNNWILMLPDEVGEALSGAEDVPVVGSIIKKIEGGGFYLKMPLPYGFNVMHALGSSTSAAARRQAFGASRGMSPGEATSQVLSSVLTAFSPIGGNIDVTSQEGAFKTIGPAVTPSAVQPFAEVFANVNFAGNPIRPERRDGEPTPDSQMYFNSVGPIPRDLTAWLNRATGGDEVTPGAVDFNPENIDHLLKAYGSGGPAFLKRTLELPGRIASGDPLNTKDIPVIRRFAGEPSEWRRERSFYAASDEAMAVKAQVDFYREQGRDESLEQIPKPMQDAADRFVDYRTRTREIRAEIATLTDDDPQHKELGAELDSLYAEAVRMMNKAKDGEEVETPLLDAEPGVRRRRRSRSRRQRREAARAN
ncbi:MAG: LPD38 domain-containing protein [Phycisphaerales bacterium]